MKFLHIKSIFLRSLLAGGLLLGGSACELDQLSDPNNPSIDLVESAALSEIQNLVSGTEAGMRNRLGTYIDDVSVIGRDYWRFSGSDPRFTSDLLGEASSTLDNNTFYTTGPYYEAYRTIKNASLLIEAVNNTPADISDTEKAHIRGFAKTIKAYSLLLALNLQNENGIRTDVEDPDNLGPFRSPAEALSDIAALLDEANGDLGGNAAAFAFELSAGFDGFDTPATFRQFNRGLAARVDAYRQDFAGVLSALDDSFFSLSGSLEAGPSYFFSTAGGDAVNPLYLPRNQNGEIRLTHPSFVAEAEAGDQRLGKVAERDAGDVTLGTSGLAGRYDVWIYRSPEAFVPILRNEELVLLYAEANIQQGNTAEAITALNVIRNSAGLADYGGDTSGDALIDEMLQQRRYSLFAEGHRWIDMRRYGRLNELPIDRDGDDVWVSFPRPANEEGQ